MSRSPNRTRATTTNRVSRKRASAKSESVVVYRGKKLAQIHGKRSPTAQALREALRAKYAKTRGEPS